MVKTVEELDAEVEATLGQLLGQLRETCAQEGPGVASVTAAVIASLLQDQANAYAKKAAEGKDDG